MNGKKKGNEIRVKYRVAKGIDKKLDKAIEKVAEEFGFSFWASGFDTKNLVRDLCFEKKEI